MLSSISSPFNDAEIKRNYAMSFLTLFEERERHYFETNPGTRLQEITQDGMIAHKIRLGKMRGDISEISIIASTAIGMLSDTLDMATCECARLAGSKNLNNIYFHVAANQSAWDREISKRTKGVPKTIVDVMRDFRPWNGGDPTFYPLKRLAAKGKHQQITPVMQKIVSSELNFGKLNTGVVKIPAWQWDNKKNELVYLITDVKNIKLCNCFTFEEKLCFQEGEILAGASVRKFIRVSHTRVGNVIEAFKSKMTGIL